MLKWIRRIYKIPDSGWVSKFLERLEGPGDRGKINYKIVMVKKKSLQEFWLNVSSQFWAVEIQMLIFLFFFFS